MEQKNLILAIALSLAIILSFQFLLPTPEAPPQPAPGTTTGVTAEGDVTVPQIPGAEMPGVAVPGAAPAINRDEALAAVPRLRIETPLLTGSLPLNVSGSVTGGSRSVGLLRIDDITLTKYRETLDPESANIVLLSPKGTGKSYFADFGWATTDANVALPEEGALWQADKEVLRPGEPVTLTWDNGVGLIFEQVLSIDEHYLFNVTQRVINNGDQPVSLAPYGLISRSGTPDVLGFYILHEGLLGVFNDALEEIDYSDLQADGRMVESSTGGWLGITDKYWLVALAPDQKKGFEGHFVHSGTSGDRYQADFIYQEILSVPAGGTGEVGNRLFAGAKEVMLLDEYRDEGGISRFDLPVDFGWFYFLTKPIFYALHYINGQVGNFGVAILILTVLIKLLFFPLANKSYRSMAQMRKLQPEMVKMKERFGDDKQRLNQEMMALYKKEKVNPMSGCLPILIQIPVFFALYKVMFVTIEMRHAPFFGWIQDLSAADPTSVLNLFGLLPWGVPELGAFEPLNLGVWPLLMGISMFLQMRLNPQPPDPIQAKIFALMPIMFTFLLAQFPAGLVIYWTWNNMLSMLQQAVIMKRAGVPIGRGKAKAKT
jgi:YidC/Oxa1 family membrane protein insertase